MNVTKKGSFRAAISHIKSMLKNMSCPACRKIVKNPHIGVCGHTLCSPCWRPLKICRICGVNSVNRLSANIALCSRSRAILQLVERFKIFNNLCERSSLINSKKKNQQKKATVPPESYFIGQEKTHSIFSQSDSNSFETIGELDTSDEEFLSISQVNHNPKYYVGPVRIDFSRYRNPINYKNNENSRKRCHSPSKGKSYLSKSAKKMTNVNSDEMELVDYVDGNEVKGSQSKDNTSKSSRGSNRHPFKKITKDTQVTLEGSKLGKFDLLDVSDERNRNLQDSVVRNKNDNSIKSFTGNESSEGVNKDIIPCQVTNSLGNVSFNMKASRTLRALSLLDKDRHALQQVLNASKEYNHGLAIMKNTINLNSTMAEMKSQNVVRVPPQSLNGSVENFQTISVNDALNRTPDPDSSQTDIYFSNQKNMQNNTLDLNDETIFSISYSYGDLTNKSESDILSPRHRKYVTSEEQENCIYSKSVGSKTALSNQNILNDNMVCYNDDFIIQFISQIHHTENREEKTNKLNATMSNVIPSGESMNVKNVGININKDSRIQDFDKAVSSNLTNMSMEIDDSIVCSDGFHDTDSPTKINLRLNQNGKKAFQNLSKPPSVDYANSREISAPPTAIINPPVIAEIEILTQMNDFKSPENVSPRKHIQSNDGFTWMNECRSAYQPLNSADLNKNLIKILHEDPTISNQKEIADSGTPNSGTQSNAAEHSPQRIVLTCSCLKNPQVAIVRVLAKRRRWTFSDVYTTDVTHLIVNVDSSNRSQRSIKYVRALAAGNWILSHKWAIKCIRTNFHVPEEPYEVLDNRGSMGPYLCRTERGTLFRGFDFFCFPPFSILDVNILSEILTNAGGNVVEYIDDIKIKDPTKISLLLGEKDFTQKGMLTRICGWKTVVAVNFQWAMDCLGKGSIIYINKWLLGRKSLLPAVDWPLELFHDADNIEDTTTVINSS